VHTHTHTHTHTHVACTDCRLAPFLPPDGNNSLVKAVSPKVKAVQCPHTRHTSYRQHFANQNHQRYSHLASLHTLVVLLFFFVGISKWALDWLLMAWLNVYRASSSVGSQLAANIRSTAISGCHSCPPRYPTDITDSFVGGQASPLVSTGNCNI
jgi:hypothetical protein